MNATETSLPKFPCKMIGIYLIGVFLILCSCTEKLRASETTAEPIIKNVPSTAKRSRKEGISSVDRKVDSSPHFKLKRAEQILTDVTPHSVAPKIQSYTGENILTVNIGPAADQIGYDSTEPGSIEGPSSFAVDRDERIYVVDTLKDRILVFRKGVTENAIPIIAGHTIDIRLLPNGNLIVGGGWFGQNSHSANALFIIDPKVGGQKEIPFGSKMFGELHVQPDGVWVEGERTIFLGLGPQKQRVRNRKSLSELPYGILSRDGKWLINATIINSDRPSLRLFLCDRKKMLDLHVQGWRVCDCDHHFADKNRIKDIEFKQPVSVWMGGYTYAQGRIYILTNHEADGENEPNSTNVLTMLSSGLEVERRVTIPDEVLNFSTNNVRNMDVTADGNVYFLSVSQDETAVFVMRYK